RELRMIHGISFPAERKMMDPDSDKVLVRAAKAGQFPAFEDLVNRYEQRIYRLSVKITANPADAGEVLQETFFKAYTHLQEFCEEASFRTWLVRIAINEGRMKLRKRRTDKSVPIEDFVSEDGGVAPREFADWKPSSEEIMAQSELRKTLLDAAGSSPFGLRTVFVLREEEGFSTMETADLLRLTETAVETQFFRTHMRLREVLTKTFQRSAPLVKRRRAEGNFSPVGKFRGWQNRKP
ncbi:MAG: sigma-70 family RNA polymerase sigma factor, partial [Acidobacteria bacterium]|nr:sigma-70 family RNA polymerase sigma factor [Acidobacteriota bacterium]